MSCKKVLGGWMWRAFGRLEKGRAAISVCRGLEDVNTSINDRSKNTVTCTVRSKNQRPWLCYRTALHEPLINKKRLKSSLTAPLFCSRSFCELAEPEAEIWAQICDAHQRSGPLSLVEPAYAKGSGCVGRASTAWRCGAHNRQRLLQKFWLFFILFFF